MKLGIALISGGIDSPVSTHLIAKRGATLIPVYFQNSPFTAGDTDRRALRVIELLRGRHYNILEPVVLNHGYALQVYQEKADPHYTCVFCKRMMARVASRFGAEQGATFIVMGDSLGQVASQTLDNIAVVEAATTLPIVRPLIGMDKVDIERIAKEIGTYDASSASVTGCSAVPDKPSTRATIAIMEREEAKLDINALIQSHFQ